VGLWSEYSDRIGDVNRADSGSVGIHIVRKRTDCGQPTFDRDRETAESTGFDPELSPQIQAHNKLLI
jgi:hypothetical protein